MSCLVCGYEAALEVCPFCGSATGLRKVEKQAEMPAAEERKVVTRAVAEMTVEEICETLRGRPNLIVGIADCPKCGQQKYETEVRDQLPNCPKCGGGMKRNDKFPTIIVERGGRIPEGSRRAVARMMQLRDGIPRAEAFLRAVPFLQHLGVRAVHVAAFERVLRAMCAELRVELGKIMEALKPNANV